ncbi:MULTISPECIES: helix-turn-helix domain-containing protein [Paraburkholderia]|uniref:Helix-turn-helix domain-containing protein n=1 Tax=Paraburkholderia madseniana TaxID=2599607 RepID=A0AAP5ETQ5_9BURK|nr:MULTISPECIES: helix-turn-helix domain-containing protein [Paraburkholderia]MCX4151536.1 helix-turn-helix domain-containing protein [Paraburkholderia madseniana]MDN7154467.1 helix-turn-helix transcriptional regulator [Paraburkholderia sp. WS6]MDQ6413349.1 helix-turn-helix transcriptional regulator [Paraburkholderia madseniana]
MKRVSFQGDGCPVARSLDVIGDLWSMLIIRSATNGARRFNDFQTRLGVARNILTARLRVLVEHGILELVPASDGTAYREYVLTAKGRGLFPVIVALRQWGEQFLFEDGEPESVMIDREQRQPVRRLELRAADNRLLSLEDIEVMQVSPKGPQSQPGLAAAESNRRGS